jgi:hypothetical protein
MARLRGTGEGPHFFHNKFRDLDCDGQDDAGDAELFRILRQPRERHGCVERLKPFEGRDAARVGSQGAHHSDADLYRGQESVRIVRETQRGPRADVLRMLPSGPA